MKIGIVTFHFAHNSGAMLQCFALQTKLGLMGHEVEVIDYRPDYHVKIYKAWKSPLEQHSLKGAVRAMSSNIHYAGRKERAGRFLEFESEFHKSALIKDADNELLGSYDALICGSDQIWNPKLTNGKFDPAYFGVFKGFTGKRIGYAVSTGEYDFVSDIDVFSSLSEGMDSISAREKKTSDRLSEILGRTIADVPDPTLLIDKEEFRRLEDKEMKLPEDYLLVYLLQNNENAEKMVAEYKRLYPDRKVIDMSPNVRTEGVDIRMRYIGPRQFLRLIDSAGAVVTNSFHGSVFSLTFGKRVSILPHRSRNERIVNLLEALDCSCFFADKTEDFLNIIGSEVPSGKIDESIRKVRVKGETFLLGALKDAD